MGRQKKLEKIREANRIKTACKYVYNLISYRWIEIWNQFWWVLATNAKMDEKKAIFFFFDFWLNIPWFEAFTIRKCQIKLEIHNPWPDISLETKFRPITLKTVPRTFFLLRPIFFWFWKLKLAVFEQSFSKIVIFDFRFGFLGSIRS